MIAFPGAASAAAFSPIAKLPEVAYATTDDIGHVYSFLSGVNHPMIGSSDVIDALRFNRAGSEVVAAGRDDTTRLYNAIEGGSPVEVLAGHGGPVASPTFGAGDTAIATASDDGTVRVWTSPIPQPSATLPATDLPPGTSALAASVGFTADSKRIVLATVSGRGDVLAARDLKVPAGFAAAGTGPRRGRNKPRRPRGSGTLWAAQEKRCSLGSRPRIYTTPAPVS